MTKEHSNNFEFKTAGDGSVKSISFSPDQSSFKISQGQPHRPIESNGGAISVKAGRHATSEVAEAFSNLINGDGSHAVNSEPTNTPLPKKLNFLFSGAQKLNGEIIINDLILAQGHTGHFSRNTWWIASTDGSVKYLQGSVGLVFNTNNGKEVYIAQAENDNAYYIDIIS